MPPLRFIAVRLLGPEPPSLDGGTYRGARWLFLRSLGLIFFSAFYSLLFQAEGLIGPRGILPAGDYLPWLAARAGPARFWVAPTLLWLGSGSAALTGLCWGGLLASILLTFNVWPRGMTALCTAAYLSFVGTLQVFSNYQSDGMLLEAGFISLFFAPRGRRPGLGESDPPSRAGRFLLCWLCFRIYFESGLAKILGGDPNWRRLTAMDEYYQNGPLPTWIGWYAQRLPHAFHAGTTVLTLVAELGLVWMFWMPRRFRIACFWVLLPFQIGIILTANYAFINYISIALSFLLLDDRHLKGCRGFEKSSSLWKREVGRDFRSTNPPSPPFFKGGESMNWTRLRLCVSGFFLGWNFYATTALFLMMFLPGFPLPLGPVEALEPFRFANRFGLFAVMTPARYEIEFEGTRDGKNWTPYPFRYKPQDLREAPRLYAPYQPRFDWNLWFASLETWRQNAWVVRTEELLLRNEPSVLGLFRANPFAGAPPRQVRALFWQYWFTDLSTRRRQGLWWRREPRGLYAPALERRPDGKIVVTEVSLARDGRRGDRTLGEGKADRRESRG